MRNAASFLLPLDWEFGRRAGRERWRSAGGWEALLGADEVRGGVPVNGLPFPPHLVAGEAALNQSGGGARSSWQPRLDLPAPVMGRGAEGRSGCAMVW